MGCAVGRKELEGRVHEQIGQLEDESANNDVLVRESLVLRNEAFRRLLGLHFVLIVQIAYGVKTEMCSCAG